METNENNSRKSKKIEEPKPIFRRREDEIKFEVIDKLTSYIKWLIAAILIILYFFYKTISNQNINDAYQIRLLTENADRLVRMEKYYSNNVNTKVLPSTCAVCHIPGRMDIIVPKEWTVDMFKYYVRGEGERFPSNGIMPKFNKAAISDQQLEEIFLDLKRDR